MNELGRIDLVHLHAIEEAIRYTEDNPDAKYEDLVKHLSWYWNQTKIKGKEQKYRPQGWVLQCVKFLTGETVSFDNESCYR